MSSGKSKGHGKEHEKGHGDSHEAIDKWEKLRSHAQRILDTTELHHREAYGHAAKEHLTDEEGQLDFERLEDEDLQKKFSESMADFYSEKAKKYFKVQGDLSKLEKDTLLSAYSGFTRETLRDFVGRYGKDFNYTLFSQQTGQIMRGLRQRLLAAAASDIEDKHIEDIVQHVGAEDVVKSDAIKKEEGVVLLEQYREGVGPKGYAKALREAGAAYALKGKYKGRISKAPAGHDHEHKKAA